MTFQVLTVGIHRRLIGLGGRRNRDRIARVDFITDLTGHRNVWRLGLALITLSDVTSSIEIDAPVRRYRHRKRGLVFAVVTLPAVSRVVTVALTSPFAASTDPRTFTLQFTVSIHGGLVRFGATVTVIDRPL
ncbi:hypothetical protein [Pectobacterium parvum]|uniref:hypothetical protein n=1 Tax=Pectobacterium parvum TaxID=2778550 RepID=UPI001FDAA541|nr:hypothetical protein [Pectobacterium parvum]